MIYANKTGVWYSSGTPNYIEIPDCIYYAIVDVISLAYNDPYVVKYEISRDNNDSYVLEITHEWYEIDKFWENAMDNVDHGLKPHIQIEKVKAFV